MGLLDSLENFASQEMEQSANPEAKVAGGLMQALDQHPGGLQGVIEAFQQNGVQPHTGGAAMTPEQVQQGVGGTGLIDSVAQKAGVSPQVAEMVLATVLPMVIAHFTQGGTQAPPQQGGFGNMAGEWMTSLFNRR